jgi:hypothetical protein
MTFLSHNANQATQAQHNKITLTTSTCTQPSVPVYPVPSLFLADLMTANSHLSTANTIRVYPVRLVGGFRQSVHGIQVSALRVMIKCTGHG